MKFIDSYKLIDIKFEKLIFQVWFLKKIIWTNKINIKKNKTLLLIL